MSPTRLLPSLTTDWISADSLTALTGFTARSTLLLGAGLAAMGLLRLTGCSAAVRFRALWLSAAGVPLLLAGSLLTGSMDSFAPLRMKFPEIPAAAGGMAGEGTGAPAALEPGNPFGAPAAVATAPGDFRAEPPDWRTVPAGLWLAGMGLTLSGMAWRHWRMGRWMRRAAGAFAGQGRIRELLREITTSARLRVTPRLFFVEGWTMPGMGGARRPWLLLPAEAERWEEGRLRHVLLHECGHIARKDAAADFWAKLALVPLWFHPLAWLVRRRLSTLREAACDDWVLTRGKAEPAAYAADLLALVKRQAAAAFPPQRSAVIPSRPRIGMASSSAAGQRIRLLLRADVRRNEPGRGLTSALAAGAAVLTACCLLLVSCESTGPDKPQPALLTLSPGEFRQVLFRSPEKSRPDADRIQFALLEITSIPGQKNFLTPWLPPDGRRDPAATAPLSFPSLHTAAQQRGVDFMTIPDTAEGQEIRWSLLRNLRYPITFTDTGAPKEFTTKELGIRLKITGEKTPDGKAVLADIEWIVEQLSGEFIYPIPGGKTVRQPHFDSRRGSLTRLRIPNGGFTILTADDAPLTTPGEALTQEQFAKLRKTAKPRRRWLALAVTSAPLPPASEPAATRSGP